MLSRVALVRTDVSEEHTATFIRVFLRSVRRLLAIASVVPSSPILVTLMKEALSSSESSVLTRATPRNIPEESLLQGSGALAVLLLIPVLVGSEWSGSRLSRFTPREEPSVRIE
jgi:hypothetical protein